MSGSSSGYSHALRNKLTETMEAEEGPETTVKLITGHKRASLTYGRMCVDPSTQGEYTNKALQSKSTSKINGCRSYLQPLRPIPRACSVPIESRGFSGGEG